MVDRKDRTSHGLEVNLVHVTAKGWKGVGPWICGTSHIPLKELSPAEQLLCSWHNWQEPQHSPTGGDAPPAKVVVMGGA